jgi:SAM-dependent methyltransferase
VSQPPILIFGVPRSGTTLLRTILNCHPHIACGPEAPWLADHASHNVMALCESLTKGELSYTQNFSVSQAQAMSRLCQLVDGLFTDFAASQGKHRWAQKTPDDCLYVDFFTQLFPEAKYLHIIRHPLDVALSTARIPEHRKGLSPWHEKNMMLETHCPVTNTLFHAVLRWRRWNDQVRAGLHAVDSLQVSYETLVTEPQKTFAALFGFLGEPFSPEILDYRRFNTIFPSWEEGSADVRLAGKITPSRIGRWKKELTPEEVRLLLSIAGVDAEQRPPAPPAPACRVASIDELRAPLFTGFMDGLNTFASQFSLKTFQNQPENWTHAWLWFAGLSSMVGRGRRVISLNSGLSPLPWLIALLGADVTLIETNPAWIPQWDDLRRKLRVKLDWQIATTKALPLPADPADVVISLSAIELQADKTKAIAELERGLKPGGVLAMSFDLDETAQGMTYPVGRDCALTMAEFEREIWFHPAFGNREKPQWNLADIPAFQAWHLPSAQPHHSVVGAAVLVKRP